MKLGPIGGKAGLMLCDQRATALSAISEASATAAFNFVTSWSFTGHGHELANARRRYKQGHRHA